MTDVGVGSGALLDRIPRMQKAHFIVGRISGFQRPARNRNVRPPLKQTGRTRTEWPSRPVPIRWCEPPMDQAGVDPLTLSLSIACEPTALIRRYELPDRIGYGPTSKMSHDGTWRASCRISTPIPSFHFESTFDRTRRDKSRRWLWRLVGLILV